MRSGSAASDDRILAALKAIQSNGEEQIRYLNLIRWSLVPIGISVVVIFCALLIGWFKIEFVAAPLG